MQTIENYQNEKNNLFTAAQAIGNSIRQRIIELLVLKNNMSFNELLLELRISRPKLAYHLQILTQYNIITNFYDKRIGVKDHSFYELSAFGRELLSGNLAVRLPGKNKDDITAIENGQVKNTPANFRTVHKPMVRNFDNIYIKRTHKSILPFDLDGAKYFDPMLMCKIKKQPKKTRSPRKVTLPSLRQYYVMYKHPFKLKKNLNQ